MRAGAVQSIIHIRNLHYTVVTNGKMPTSEHKIAQHGEAEHGATKHEKSLTLACDRAELVQEASQQ